jgi:hypothetical protein
VSREFQFARENQQFGQFTLGVAFGPQFASVGEFPMAADAMQGRRLTAPLSRTAIWKNRMGNLRFNLIVFHFGLKAALQREIGKDSSRRVMKKMREHFEAIDKHKPKQNGIMGFHRMLLIIGISLYRAMQDELGNQGDLVETIHRVLWESRVRDLTRIIAFFVRRSKDPFNLYLRLLGPKNEFLFPCPPWEKVEVELNNGIGWHQNKCPYYDLFKEEGVVELTKAYCEIDKRVAELVPNNIEFKRQGTLADGENYCDFYYYKK